ncbi:MAG: class I SAM-dependent methyltransferase [Bacillota bacterium]|nr:class I SAM-dependent methyltransferase [Bacillota bacterium]
MQKVRIPETSVGIIGEALIQDYDEMQRRLRDRGLLETSEIIKSGITEGTILEIGPGPGYVGLEWLKKCQNSSLYWLEISRDMGNLAVKNADIYKMKNKVNLNIADATKEFPFESNFFDHVFTCGSLHEWSNPVDVLNEIERVLKVNGKFFIGDLKRNIRGLIAMVMGFNLRKKVMKDGLKSSINAAYTKSEITELFSSSKLTVFEVRENPFGLSITGRKMI